MLSLTSFIFYCYLVRFAFLVASGSRWISILTILLKENFAGKYIFVSCCCWFDCYLTFSVFAQAELELVVAIVIPISLRQFLPNNCNLIPLGHGTQPEVRLEPTTFQSKAERSTYWATDALSVAKLSQVVIG